MKPIPKQWHHYAGYEVSRERVGLGMEFSVGAWWPREWSVHLIVGPLLVWFGIEECDDFCLEHNHFREPL